MYRSRASLLALLVVGLSVAPSACSLPFAYVDGDGSGGEGGDDGNEDGSGAASSGSESGGSGGDETGGASSDGDTGGAGTGGDASDGDTGGSGGSGASGGGDTSGGGGGSGGDPNAVTVQLGQERQEMVGFGISNAFAPVPLTEAEANVMFGTGDGEIGLSILRIAMDENGEPQSGVNTYADMELAASLGVETFIATTHSPPGSYKSNGSTGGGGSLLPQYYDQWSDRIAEFPNVVANATGLELFAMSAQAEPDFATCGVMEPCDGDYESTVYSSEELVEFIKVLGPKLHGLTPPVQVIAPETRQWSHLWSNESATGSVPSGLNGTDPLGCGFPPTECAPGEGYDYGHALYADQAAWDAFDIVGTHQFETQRAEPWPSDITDRKPVWMTEMAGIRWWPEYGPSSDIANGLVVAGWIHDALTVGEASAWLWFWQRAYYADANMGLVLKDGTVAKRQWTLGNYSKFVRPGFTRVEITGSVPSDVLLSAFKGPQGQVVIVAINRMSSATTVPIAVTGGTAPTSFTPYVTSADEDLLVQNPISTTDGVLDASLTGTSVTTFVSD